MRERNMMSRRNDRLKENDLPQFGTAADFC